MADDTTSNPAGDVSIVDMEKVKEETPEAENITETKEISKTDSAEEQQYPGPKRLALILIALYAGFFLVALDRTIIATAIPRITDEFDSLNDVGWYGSSYLLTGCTFQLLFGRIYTFYSPKWVFIIAIGLFEVGSLLCGAAPNSTALIIGRAIAGLGSAGIFSGAIVIIVYAIPLQKRPVYIAFTGAIFGIASVIGPLLGGAFTEYSTWRFYINLPIGAVATIIVVFVLKLPAAKKTDMSLLQQFNRLDPVGNLFFLPGMVCLLLALQWGGSTYAWNDPRIIAMFVLFGVFIITFIGIQLWKKDIATVPPHIISQRSVAAGLWYSFVVGSAMIVLVYFLPIWFQAVQGVSAVESGIRLLPLILSLVVGSISSGIVVRRTGYYTQFLYVGCICLSIGIGLMTTFTVDISEGKWIGFQILAGYGIGCAIQQPSMAAQNTLKKKDVPTGVSLMFFGQQLGGAIFVSIGQNVFSNRLISGLASVPGLNPNIVVNTGATDLRNVVAPQDLGLVLVAYNHALTSVFQAAVGAACLAIIGALAMEWKSIKKPKKEASGSA
ncbi:hypothetical protein MMC11_002524 [Xylographa trunciseda]|nr:hypothetical protein [Xylographa trunciseda]